MFICGVFSLLDRMFQKPFDELLSTLPVPADVHAALVEESGPYHCVLELVRTLEGGSGLDVRDHVQACNLSMRHVNRALLRSLGSALHVG